jgi:uncharacterized protein
MGRLDALCSTMRSTGPVAEQLCVACGLCCNGVLFKDVELQQGDAADRLKALGLPLERLRCKARFAQPCLALGDDCRCRIYADRPRRCREFECALFKEVQAGRVESAAALRTIRAALQRADKVQRLLQKLGDTDVQVALSLRFKRMHRRLEASPPDEDTAAMFADLSLALHDLNRLLQRDFFP